MHKFDLHQDQDQDQDRQKTVESQEQEPEEQCESEDKYTPNKDIEKVEEEENELECNDPFFIYDKVPEEDEKPTPYLLASMKKMLKDIHTIRNEENQDSNFERKKLLNAECERVELEKNGKLPIWKKLVELQNVQREEEAAEKASKKRKRKGKKMTKKETNATKIKAKTNKSQNNAKQKDKTSAKIKSNKKTTNLAKKMKK